MEWWHILLIYLFIVNVINFFFMGFDKWKARKDRWRVPERNFFLLALIGGSLGGILGMYAFRHKTKHWYFKIGLPVIFVLQVFFAIWFFFFR